MADIVNQFESVLISYSDVKREHPTWSELAVEDYMARQRDLVKVADKTTGIESAIPTLLTAQLNEINARIGSGDPLTCDETGFTVDSIKLTVDMTEA